jgi:hypothetical protein
MHMAAAAHPLRDGADSTSELAHDVPEEDSSPDWLPAAGLMGSAAAPPSSTIAEQLPRTLARAHTTTAAVYSGVQHALQ